MFFILYKLFIFFFGGEKVWAVPTQPCAAVARFHLFRFAVEYRLYIGDLLGDAVAHCGDCLLGGRFDVENQFAQVLDLVL